MFERFNKEARAVVVEAQLHARRLGHGYLGCEHLLLALTSSEREIGRLLYASGVTPSAVEAALLRLLGTPGGTLDSAALAVIGIDLGAVREKIEASFGPDALSPGPRRGYRRRWGRRLRCDTGAGKGAIPFTARAKKCLERSLREAKTLHQDHIGAEHLALALTDMTDGLAPDILSTVGASSVRLRAEILNGYRQAG